LNDKAANEFLVEAAKIREDIQRKEMALAKERFESLAFFGYLAGPNKHLAKAYFYKACYDYVAAVLQCDETAFVAKEGENDPLISRPGGGDNPAEMDCPINLKFDWGVAKFELSCDKFKIGAFGAIIKGSRNVKTKQSTLQIGAELSKDFKKGIGNINGTIKAGAEKTFFVTFDDHGNFVDAGLSFEAKAGASISAGVKTGMDQIKALDPTVKGDHTIFGYTLGVNSGWTFKDGSLNPVIDSIIGAL
jgi:hypothetical protein